MMKETVSRAEKGLCLEKRHSSSQIGGKAETLK